MKRGVVIMAAVASMITGWALTGLAQNRQDPTAVTEQKALAAFKITVARTSDGVSLTCEKGGCAWGQLSFSFSGKPIAVNDYGMAGTAGNPESKGKFLMHFGAENDTFALTCERGCAWKTLGFPATATPVPIDQYGMANKK